MVTSNYNEKAQSQLRRIDAADAAGDTAKVEEIVQEMQALAERTKLPSPTEKQRLKDLREIRDFIRELRKRIKEGTVEEAAGEEIIREITEAMKETA
jgi:hypothetical protein